MSRIDDQIADNLEPGTKLGYYTVVRRLGAGGYGTLYEVERGGSRYALKVLRPGDDPHWEERGERELATLKSLRHPNIVRVHAADRWPDLETGYPYFVMDLIDGQPVLEWVSDTSPSPLMIVEVFEKIAGAADYMHGCGVFHRDLKSENVLVDKEGKPILLDFGIAKSITLSRLTRHGNFVGTEIQYPPECCRFFESEAFRQGEDFQWTPPTDLYGLGYMLYEALAGKPPFGDRPRADLWRVIMSVVPQAPSLVNPAAPGALDAVVLKLLEKDPGARYQTGNELAAALAQLRIANAGEAAWAAPFVLPSPKRGPSTAGRTRRGSGEQDDLRIPSSVGSADDDPASTSSGVATLAQTPLMKALAAQYKNTPAPSTPRSGPAPGFSPPTRGSPAFVSAELSGERQAPGAADDDMPRLPSGVREVQERFASTRPAPSDRHNLYVILGVVSVLVLASVGLLALALRPREQQPTNLMAKVTKASEAQATAPGPGTAPPAAPPSAPAPAPGVSAAAHASPTSAPAAAAPGARPDATTAEADAPAQVVSTPHSRRPRSGGTSAEAASIDRELVKRYGGRPTLGDTPEEKQPQKPQPPPDPDWMKRSQDLDGPTRLAQAGAAKQVFGIPLGSHIPVKLLTALDSRTVGSGPVEVRLMRPFIVRQKITLPAGTMVYGHAMANAGRFTVNFTRIRLPDDREAEFKGIAMDHEDGKAGLPAGRRIGSKRQEQEGVGTSVAKGAAGTVLNGVTGGVGQDLVRGAGQTVISHQDYSTGGGDQADLLDPGVMFDIWVEGSF